MSEDASQNDEEYVFPLTLDFNGIPGGGGGEGNVPSGVSIQKFDEHGSSIRILVSLPRLVDTEHATRAADMLLEEFEKIDGPYFIEKVKLVGLRFTSGGISGMTTFLSMHASEVKKLVLNDIICGRIVPADETNFLALCQTFQNSQLDIIDLSYNAIGSYLWKAFEGQQVVKTLFLHDIEMDDASFQSLNTIFVWGRTLSTFHVANLTGTGNEAVAAMNDMLSTCDNMRTFAWISDCQVEDIPAFGLARLSQNMFKNNFSCLKNLELSGGVINVQRPENIDICEALESLHKLQILKLRHAGLTSEKIKRIVAAVRTARPPLSCIDFAYNNIDCEGAHWISQLSCLKAVTKNLRILNLEHNALAQKGALEVVETFASKSSEFHLMLNGNAFDSGSLALSLASAKHSAETEVAELRKERTRLQAAKTDAQSNLRELLSAQSAMLNDMNELQAKAKQLEEDKEGLIKAFSVLGMMQHTKERDLILKRLSKLEEAVLGESEKSTPQRNTPRKRSEDDEMPEPTCLSRTISTEDSRPPPKPDSKPSRPSPAPSMSRRSMRPSARGLLVKAASERWKNLLSKPNSSRGAMTRAASTKSLAEFLSSDSDRNRTDDMSLDDDSIQTTPAALGDLRERLKRDESSSALENDGHGSFRSLPAFDVSSFGKKGRYGGTPTSSLDSLPQINGSRPQK